MKYLMEHLGLIKALQFLFTKTAWLLIRLFLIISKVVTHYDNASLVNGQGETIGHLLIDLTSFIC